MGKRRARSIPQGKAGDVEGNTEDGSLIGDVKIAGNTLQTATVSGAAE
jgi:hypothetical protein